jgi:hypothetical protein
MLVLDTNAVLDWLVFADPYLEGLTAAIQIGKVEVVGHPLVLEELRRVLAYPLLKLDAFRQGQVLADYQARLTQAELPDGFGSDHFMLPDGFPRCRDPDDQVFLALAYHAQAVLVSRDKVVLKLAKRVRRFGVQILSPQQLPDWLVSD